MSRLQVASHLISGLSAAVEGCARALSAFYGTHSVGPPSRVAVAKAAYNVSPTSRTLIRGEHACSGNASQGLHRTVFLMTAVLQWCAASASKKLDK